jgi:pimeloyl-ACP methyl ester carboxylesterase
MLHDWGSYVGLLFCNTYPDRVSRLVVIDVGIKEQNTVTIYEGLVIASYQWALAMAFIVYKLLGETAGSVVFILSIPDLLSL